MCENWRRERKIRKILTLCNLHIRAVLIFKNTKTPQVPQTQTAYMFILRSSLLRVVFDKLLISHTYTRSVCTYLIARPTAEGKPSFILADHIFVYS
jgi:hypothetical protein